MGRRRRGSRGALLDYYDTHDQAAIMGDVVLSCYPAIHVDSIYILPSVRNKQLTVRASVSNASDNAVEATLHCSVRLKGEAVLSLPETKLSVPALESTRVEITAPWNDPILWGPPPLGKPVLYHLQSELRAGDGVLDKRFDRFGFRELWTDGTSFRFNGKPVFLMGTHISGFEMREAMTLLVPALQQAGFLFLHPHADNRLQGFYDVCDELGMLVWDCTFCGGPIGNRFGGWGGDRKKALRQAEPHLESAYRAWVRRNRNHASVVIWSAGCNNEELHGTLRKVIQQEDPTRPVVTYDEPETPREVRMFGFPGWEGDHADFTKGIRSIDQQLARRGEKRYPLFIGEYWSRSGVPRAMEITWEKGVAGGCAFDVGGFKGCLPPFHPDFEISWPSESGWGHRRRSLLLRGHKRTFPEARHSNWCDKDKTVFRGEWAEQAGYRRVSEKANGAIEPATMRAPEVIVTAKSGGKPLAGKHVLIEPAGGQSTNPVGVMTDPNGRAWFVLQEAGPYRAVCAGRETAFDAQFQPLKLEPGYDYIQWVPLPD